MSKPIPALQAARDIKAMCFIEEDQGRGDEVRTWATLDENLAAERIQEALEAQHRKTWALATKSVAKICQGYESLVDEIILLPCPPIEATKDK